VTRGVLLDWYAYAQRKNLPHRPFTDQAITLRELLQVSREQDVTFRRGDILVIRTGWTAAYSRLTDTEKERLGGRDDRASCGVEATEEAIRWHWEQGFSAVASDTVAYEAWPSPKPWGVCMHEVSDQGLVW
jgi:kynurenine formamidase